MNYTTAMEQIAAGRIAPVYLLYGEETYLVHELEKRLIDALLPSGERELGLTILDSDPSPDGLSRLVETTPFFTDKNVIVLRGTSFFRTKKGASQTEEAESSVENVDVISESMLKLIASIPDYSYLVFVAGDKVDKRKKLFKAVEKYGVVVELAALKARDVRPWIITQLAKMNKKMTTEAQEHLLAIVSIMPQVSLGFLASELEKVALFSGKRETISHEDLIKTLSHVPEVSVFVMLEALSQKQTAKAIELLSDQLTSGDYPLPLLAWQVRMLWQAKWLSKQGYDPHEIASELKVSPFVGEKLLRQSRSFSAEKLQEGLLRLANADRDMKVGKADGRVLEQFVIELCQ